MSRTCRSVTRRQWALFWTAALTALILASQLLGLYCVTPAQALRREEHRHGAASTEVLQKTPLSGREVLLFSADGSRTELSRCAFHWARGWECILYNEGRQSDAPLTLSKYWAPLPGRETLAFYGAVVGDLQSVALFWEADDLRDGEVVPLQRDHAVLPASELLGDGAQRFFWLCPETELRRDGYWRCCAVGIRADGSVVTDGDTENMPWIWETLSGLRQPPAGE